MAKIMLVEDDKNLSAIYKDRLLAEGYEIVTAQDGEEALAIAVKEKPDLIVADVMMPKISGFDMLDILRSTPETKNTKVIMMTALSQAEDQQRAAQLGADKYLVKSQVTLDDVARVVRETLEGGNAPALPQIETAAQQEPQATAPPENTTASTEIQKTVEVESPKSVENTQQQAENIPAESIVEEKKEIEDEIQNLANTIPVEAPVEVAPTEQVDESGKEKTEEPKHGGERIVQPISSPDDKPDIMALYEKEIANESPSTNLPAEQSQNQEQQPDKPVDPHSISL